MNIPQHQKSTEALRKAHGFFKSQDQFSMVTGIPASTLSNLVNGQRTATAAQAVLIEHATGGKVKRGEIRPDLYDAKGQILKAQEDVSPPVPAAAKRKRNRQRKVK